MTVGVDLQAINSAQIDTSMLMSILHQVGAKPSQSGQENAPSAVHTLQGPAEPTSNVATLMQQHGVKLINPIGQDPRQKPGATPLDPRQPVKAHRQNHHPSNTMETPELAGDGGLEMSNQMMSLMQKFTG